MMPAWLRLGPIPWTLTPDDLPRPAPWVNDTHDGWTRTDNGFRCDCGTLCGTETVWRNHAADHGLKWGTTSGQKGTGARWSDIVGEIEQERKTA